MYLKSAQLEDRLSVIFIVLAIKFFCFILLFLNSNTVFNLPLELNKIVSLYNASAWDAISSRTFVIRLVVNTRMTII